MSAPASLDILLLRALASEWTGVNHWHLKGALTLPVFDLLDGEHHLGEWRRLTRTISFSRTFIRAHPWGVAVEVLKHEMAHQYAHEVLGAVDETPHGPAFRQGCARLGIDPTASGLPASRPEDEEQDKVMRRITRLLALAESPNVNEAQSAMNAAQKLMLRYNISARPSDHTFRHLGDPAGRIVEADRLLASVLGQHFFVRPVWVPFFDIHTGKSGRILEICGTPGNLDLASYVFGFLRQTGNRLWQQHKRAAQIRGDKDRQRFVAGVMRGFHEKLQAGVQESREEGLVWIGDPRLAEYLGKRHPAVRQVRYGGAVRTEAWEQGRAAGREIVLHKPVTESAGNRGRMLA